MNAMTDFPTLLADAEVMPVVQEPTTALTDAAKIDLQTVALAKFGDWRQAVAKVRADLSTLVLDLSNQSRIAEAKSLRQRVINVPIADARAASKALKSKLTAVSKAVGAEEEAIVAAYTEAGQILTAQIDEAEAKIEAEKAEKARQEAERARLEAERIAGLKGQADTLMRVWLERCAEPDMTAERIGKGIEQFNALSVPADLADVADYWSAQQSITLGRMQTMQADMARREEAARLAAERAELERQRAELEAQQAAARAELARLEQERKAAEEADRPKKKELLPKEATNVKSHPIHGFSYTPEYRAWQAMRKRCTNPLNARWADYGGRGITVCERWLNDVSAFIADMGAKPSDDHELDRIDNDGGYSPENCRWVLRSENNRNKSNNRILEFNGQSKTLIEWSESTGINYWTIRSRIDDLGWSVDRALTETVGPNENQTVEQPAAAGLAGEEQAQAGVAENPHQQQAGLSVLSPADAAADGGAGAEVVAAADDAPAAPAFALTPEPTDLLGDTATIPEQTTEQAARALLDHIAEAFTGRFPSDPKPGRAWFSTLNTLACNLNDTI